jgi:hypothetical protein
MPYPENLAHHFAVTPPSSTSTPWTATAFWPKTRWPRISPTRSSKPAPTSTAENERRCACRSQSYPRRGRSSPRRPGRGDQPGRTCPQRPAEVVAIASHGQPRPHQDPDRQVSHRARHEALPRPAPHSERSFKASCVAPATGNIEELACRATIGWSADKTARVRYRARVLSTELPLFRRMSGSMQVHRRPTEQAR